MEAFNRSYFLLILLSGMALPGIMSCKKDPAPVLPGETVLNKKFRNGALETEYLYSPGNYLERINEYNTSTGQLSSFEKFEYDTRGFLQSHSAHKASGKITSEITYLKDGDGKFKSADFQSLNGADSGKVTIRYKYEYNADGLISKQSWNDPVTGTEESYRLFFYYPNGNLKRYEFYLVSGASAEKALEVTYSPAGKPLPESIVRHKGYPVNFTIFLFAAEKIRYTTFDSGYYEAGAYEQLISGQKYNDEGFITELILTTNYIQPAKAEEEEKIGFSYKTLELNNN